MELNQASHWLYREYEARRTRNPRYSLRRFSTVIGVSPGALSEIFTNRRRITPSAAQRIVQRLSLPGEKGREFLDLVKAPANNILPLGHTAPPRQLREDHFNFISDWYHFALLSLLETTQAFPHKGQIAARLGITPEQVTEAFARLGRLGLIERNEQGGWNTTSPAVMSPSGIPSRAIREAHKQVLEKAAHSLDEIPLEERDFSTMTLAIDPARMGEARRMIAKFRKRFAAKVERGKRESLYLLSIQFFPTSSYEAQRLRKTHKRRIPRTIQ